MSLVTDYTNFYKYEKLLKQYCYVGGMPEVVSDFVENKDFMSVRELQLENLSAYEKDFTKHISENTVAQIRLLWKSIPTQLSKENKIFTREGSFNNII